MSREPREGRGRPPPGGAAWLSEVHHDLCKPLLWPARDRRDAGGPVRHGELVVITLDSEGRPAPAAELWRVFRSTAPTEIPGNALDDFGRAVDSAVAAAANDDLVGVLALEAACEALARIVREKCPAS